MDIELMIKGVSNNNVRCVSFPITKEQLLKELEQLGDRYIIIGIKIDGKEIAIYE